MRTLPKIALLLALTVPLMAQVFSGVHSGSPGGPGNGIGQLITLNSSKTYLINSYTGHAVFIVGDSCFNLFTQLSANSDIATYLSDRQAKGINTCWAAVVDNAYHGAGSSENNAFGNSPWTSGSENFAACCNSAYFAQVDWVLQQASQYGMTIIMGTAFVGSYGTCSGEYVSAMESASDATMQAYGAYLGARYKDYNNIIWLIGGDSNIAYCGSALQTKENDIAVGIKSQDPNHLITVEETNNSGGVPAYTEWGSGYSWFNLNTIYPKSGVASTDLLADYSQANQSYQHSSQPTFSIEDDYETEASMTNQQLRQEAYIEVLSGATLGRLFGSSAIWPFNASCCEPGSYSWSTDIDATPSVNQQYLGQLFRSREFWKMAPDTTHSVLTGGVGSGATGSVCGCTSDGQTCIVYDPIGNSQAPQIAMSHFSGTVHAWWFNPSSAATTDLSTFTNSGTQTFTPADGNDWVLVLDLASAGLAAPGTTTE